MRHIQKVAVLGSGVMGAQIACHFANAGLQVLLLDIVPEERTEEEKEKELTLNDKAVRNRIVNQNLQKTLKMDPAPLFKKSYADRITTGNFEDDLDQLKEMDWIVEAVVEDLDIKQSLFERVEEHRTEGTLISTNTSGLSVNSMIKNRSEDFQQHFCGTHFFNPPRYLELLEVVPTQKTKSSVLEFVEDYGDRYLGKTAIRCKDTPAFIANRVGIFAISYVFKLMQDMELTVEEVDQLTGPVIGRPKSATFRTCDLVGVDTLYKVMKDLSESVEDDEARELFTPPSFVKKLVDKEWTGSKAGQGFYKKVKEEGESKILALRLDSFEYEPRDKSSFETLEMAKQMDSLPKRLKNIMKGQDKAAEFIKKMSFALFAYASKRVPEIADELYKVDEALKAGFGWEIGPFEHWDILGVEDTIKYMEEAGFEPADWVYEMVENDCETFYKTINGKRRFYDIEQQDYQDVPGTQSLIFLDNYRTEDKVLWNNKKSTLFDIGEGVLNLEFHSKMNTIGGEVLSGINKALDFAEEDYRGVVIGNEGQHFSAGANVGMIFMFAAEQEFDELEWAIRRFQSTMMRLRYSPVPVVAAPHGLTLGGGCELCLHADAVVPAAETYMGLVEVGVGLVPAGGGTKEMTLRTSDSYYDGDPKLPRLQQTLLTVAQAKVARSAVKAYDYQYLQPGKDMMLMNKKRLITEAKKRVLQLADRGYTQPLKRKDITVVGRAGLGLFYTGAYAMNFGKYITDYDRKVSEKLAYVMCGGDLSEETEVSEDYLLDLEREAFLSLCGEKKTLKRLESFVKTGKPVRN